MDALETVEGYTLLAAIECDNLYADENDPDQDYAELESIIHDALSKIAQIKQKRAD